MTLKKKIAAMVGIILLLVAAGCLLYQYYNTSKQIYEGVLVERPIEVESTMKCA